MGPSSCTSSSPAPSAVLLSPAGTLHNDAPAPPHFSTCAAADAPSARASSSSSDRAPLLPSAAAWSSSSYSAAMGEITQRYARTPHLWALGVGAVISGDFFGWQSALIAGFDGCLVILSVVTVLYVLLSFSIAELSTTVPVGGGPYVFALHGIGRKAAFFAGIAESLKVIVTCAVIVTGIGSYFSSLLGTSDKLVPLWWVLFYALFCGLNVLGIVLSFRIQVFTTVLSVILLLVFYVAAATQVSYQEWVVDQDFKFNDGMDGILRGFSFSLWFYLGIEELPLAVEETIEPERNMPRGLISSILTLIAASYCTVIFNSMISPGASVIASSGSPLLEGYKSVFGDNSTTSGFTWLLIVGLIASFHSFIYCMGRLLLAIARDGFMPKVLTTLDKRGTPYVSFLVGSGLGLALALILHWAIGDVRLGSVLINLALIGALVSYSFQLTSFTMLRLREPSRPRPYRSPFGIVGACVCQVICIFVLFCIVYSGAKDSDFLASIIVAIVYFGLGAVYLYKFVDPNAGEHLLADHETGLAKINDSLLSPLSQKH